MRCSVLLGQNDESTKCRAREAFEAVPLGDAAGVEVEAKEKANDALERALEADGGSWKFSGNGRNILWNGLLRRVLSRTLRGAQRQYSAPAMPPPSAGKSKRAANSSTLSPLAATRGTFSKRDQRGGMAAVPQCHGAYSTSE